MTNQQHPFTPSPELVKQWLGEYFGCIVNGELNDSERFLTTRAARRPKPPSLAEEALALLQPGEPRLFNEETQDTLRRALEKLQELEGGND